MNQSLQQLELKDLTHYLPYGLQVYWLNEKEEGKFIIDKNGAIMEMTVNNILHFSTHNYSTKPLLIPISEIRTEKYIHIFFQKDTFMDEVTNSDNQFESASAFASRFKITDNDYCYPYEFFDLLFQYHFDAFGLIDASLALNKMDFIQI